jgi:5-methyltetrahydrofolate--homocysteine methyltransferase
MNSAFRTLLSSIPVITDGAWGTQLQTLGLSSGDCPDEWNLSHPDRVLDVARRYVRAGSQVILTNTFRGNRIALAGFGLQDQAAAINRAGVEISRQAAGEHVAVFASMGPTGKMLMTGEVSADEIQEAYREQASVLAGAGADALLIETQTDLEEAKLALDAAKTTGIPVIVSMVFDSGKDKDRTMMGCTVEQVAEELAAAGADAIGANCGLGIEGYLPIGRRMRAATDLPVWIKPNAGLPELVEGTIVYRITPAQFAGYANGLRSEGVHFIGGCCGTTPEFIRELNTAFQTSTTAEHP